MANYDTQYTLNPTDLRLTNFLVAALKLTGASVEGTKLTLVDQVAEGEPLLYRDAYIYWESGLQNPEDAGETDGTEPSDEDARCLILASNIEDLLREVLKINRYKTDHLKLEGASTCSRMRPDGFGGSALVVTETHFAWISTDRLTVEDGKIECKFEVVPFETQRTTGPAELRLEFLANR